MTVKFPCEITLATYKLPTTLKYPLTKVFPDALKFDAVTQLVAFKLPPLILPVAETVPVVDKEFVDLLNVKPAVPLNEPLSLN